MRLIDADELKEAMEEHTDYKWYLVCAPEEVIDLAPAIEERPHGEWIYHKEWEVDGECAFECSKCGMGTDVDYNFCPNCGADMREEGDANENE